MLDKLELEAKHLPYQTKAFFSFIVALDYHYMKMLLIE